MVKQSAEIIQAFPIQANTYVGTPTSIDAVGFNIIHAASDCDITFNFRGGSSVIVSVITGQDLAIGNDCEFITATADIWMS